MDDLVGQTTALVTATAAVVTVLSTLAKVRLRNRARTQIRRDIELLADLPDGQARERFKEAVDLQVLRLADRITGGFRIDLIRLTAIYGTMFLVLGLTTVLLERYDGQLWSNQDILDAAPVLPRLTVYAGYVLLWLALTSAVLKWGYRRLTPRLQHAFSEPFRRIAVSGNRRLHLSRTASGRRLQRQQDNL